MSSSLYPKSFNAFFIISSLSILIPSLSVSVDILTLPVYSEGLPFSLFFHIPLSIVNL